MIHALGKSATKTKTKRKERERGKEGDSHREGGDKRTEFSGECGRDGSGLIKSIGRGRGEYRKEWRRLGESLEGTVQARSSSPDQNAASSVKTHFRMKRGKRRGQTTSG